jgi:hypothetical protein
METIATCGGKTLEHTNKGKWMHSKQERSPSERPGDVLRKQSCSHFQTPIHSSAELV